MTFSMIVPPTAGIPSRAGIWPMVMTTASPMTNPVTTDAARNCDRKPSLAAPGDDQDGADHEGERRRSATT